MRSIGRTRTSNRRHRPAIESLPGRHLRRNSPYFSAYRRRRLRRRSYRTLFLPLVLIAALVALRWSGLLDRSPHHASQSRTALLSVSGMTVRGATRGGAFVLSTALTLSWRSSARAVRYRVQVAQGPRVLVGTGTALFRKPLLSAITDRPSRTLRIDLPGTYYWRVQAEMGKVWGRYTLLSRIVLVPPRLAQPALLLPRNGERTGVSPRLCWASVPHAGSYRLRLSGRPTMTVSGRCWRVTLRPGIYTWNVAALLDREPSIVGPYSPSARFTVVAPVRRRSVRGPRRPAGQVLAPVGISPVRQAMPVTPVPFRPPFTPPTPVVRQWIAPPTAVVRQRITPRTPVPRRPTPPRQATPLPVLRATAKPAPPVHYSPPATPKPRPTISTGCIPLYTC